MIRNSIIYGRIFTRKQLQFSDGKRFSRPRSLFGVNFDFKKADSLLS